MFYLTRVQINNSLGKSEKKSLFHRTYIGNSSVEKEKSRDLNKMISSSFNKSQCSGNKKSLMEVRQKMNKFYSKKDTPHIVKPPIDSRSKVKVERFKPIKIVNNLIFFDKIKYFSNVKPS